MRPVENLDTVREAVRHNDRLSQYESFIGYAREQNYAILPLEEFYLLPAEEKLAGRHLILRHDVDAPGPATRALFETERKLGVRSVYYFRGETMDLPLMREMHDAGFEVGFHCETVTHYIWAHDCESREQVDWEGVCELFAQELKEFEDRCGFKTRSCCGHGDYVCRRLRMTNGQFMAHTDPARFGLLFEAYDKEMYERFISVHIMDNELPFHYGFAYADTLCDALERGERNILFLAHPNHWLLNRRTRIRFAFELLTGKACESSDRKFRRSFDDEETKEN